MTAPGLSCCADGGSEMNGRPPRPPRLDERLRAAFDMVAPCQVCADIGADHGRLSAELLLHERAQHMLVTDLSSKSLAKARNRLEGLRLEHRVTFAIADGLAALDALPAARADTICILGMGAETLAGILIRGHEKLLGATMVLSAQTEQPRLRQAVVDVDYRIREERPVQQSGRWYLLIRATPATEGEAAYGERELFAGPCLLRDKPIQGKAFLLHRKRLLLTMIRAIKQTKRSKDIPRLARLECELQHLESALLEDGWKESGD